MFQLTQEHIDMWNRGWSCRNIAQVAGVSRTTVCRAMRRMGFDLCDRPQPIIAKAIDESLSLREEGVSMRKISEDVGYSVRQIQRWLNPGVAG